MQAVLAWCAKQDRLVQILDRYGAESIALTRPEALDAVLPSALREENPLRIPRRGDGFLVTP